MTKDNPAMASFNWQDPFLLEDQLNEEERMLRDAAAAYAAEKLQPRIIEAYRRKKPTPRFSPKWVRWGCWALLFQKNTAALARGTWLTV